MNAAQGECPSAARRESSAHPGRKAWDKTQASTGVRYGESQHRAQGAQHAEGRSSICEPNETYKLDMTRLMMTASLVVSTNAVLNRQSCLGPGMPGMLVSSHVQGISSSCLSTVGGGTLLSALSRGGLTCTLAPAVAARGIPTRCVLG